MNPVKIRPKKRSPIRIKLGKIFYTWKRYVQWFTDGNRYAFQKDSSNFYSHKGLTHKTILMRKLKDVDMWYQTNKVINLQLAIEKLNGVIVRPGETFSYWRLIGKPTKGKGYVDGMVLHYGAFQKGVGGGLCQLSNLIYWITLHTPLTVTERHRHSFDVFPDSNRTQPFGSGATCSYNYMDLQIKNETEMDFQLHLYLTDTHLVGEWKVSEPLLYTYQIYEKDHKITPAYWGGYLRQNIISRKVFNRQGVQIDDENITENHAIMMYEPLLENSKEAR